MLVFNEEEIEKGTYTNFYSPENRIGYELQFDSIVPMMADTITLSRIQEGEWLFIDGVIKDTIIKLTFFIMSKLGYVENKAPIPTQTNKLLSNSKIITQSMVKLMVFEIISLSPLILNGYGHIIDKSVLYILVTDLEKLCSLNNRSEFKYICKMYINAVKMLLENVDAYNRRLIDTKTLC